MLSRKARFHLLEWTRPLTWFDRLFLRKLFLNANANGYFDGIIIANVSINQGISDAFLEVTKDALELIRHHDPRRFSMIKREIKYIVCEEILSRAVYHRTLRECGVASSAQCLDKQNPDHEWYLAQYAATLVHEATHGRLETHHIPYTKATRARIERICRTEQRRFVSRLKSEHYDIASSVPEFDEAQWHFSWKGSRWQKAKKGWATIRQAYRASRENSRDRQKAP